MRKGQIGLMETIAVLFIFLVLVLIGFMFFFRYQRGSVQELGEQLKIQKAVDVSWRISFLPELLCSDVQKVSKDCFDKLKLGEAKGAIEDNKDMYFDLFGFSEIYVETYYPEEEKFVLYNFTANLTNTYFNPFPVAVYDPIKNTYNFGVLKVYVYS